MDTQHILEHNKNILDKLKTYQEEINYKIVDKLDTINLNHVDLTFEDGSNEREKTYSFLKHQINDIIHDLKHKDK